MAIGSVPALAMSICTEVTFLNHAPHDGSALLNSTVRQVNRLPSSSLHDCAARLKQRFVVIRHGRTCLHAEGAGWPYIALSSCLPREVRDLPLVFPSTSYPLSLGYL